MRLILIPVGLVAVSAAPAAAQRFDDTVSPRVEACFAGISSSLRADGSGGTIGTEIDLEDDLGLSASKALPAIEPGWRINDGWVIQREKLEVGLGIGLHGTDFPVFVEGEGTISGQSSRLRREGPVHLPARRLPIGLAQVLPACARSTG